MSHRDTHQLNRQTPVPGKPGGQPGTGGQVILVLTSGQCLTATPTSQTSNSSAR
ncbi:hypothetical protein [Aeromonas caviae]|uniref:hypothetical protein n=1 Tax=Aeromonas caviae TaxID=648 RepID=UPI0025B66BB1|nr:hypothetical protein [Aeromonas caviae]